VSHLSAPEGWIAFDYAILRVVPRVHRGAAVNVGVALHARTVDFLDTRIRCDREWLQVKIPELDSDLLHRYLDACRAIVGGDGTAGPVALAPASERFHWLTAPRSDVIQASPVHGGLTRDPSAELERLFLAYTLD
jgi:hypothetical protein